MPYWSRSKFGEVKVSIKVKVTDQKHNFVSHLTGLWVILEVKDHMGEGDPKVHDIRRWAHDNVKLHFFQIKVLN